LQPDYVWVALGANDHGVEPATLAEVIRAWLVRARQAFPSAEIFCVVPFHGENRAGVSTAVPVAPNAATAVPAAKPTAAAAVPAAPVATSDPHIHLIDLGHELESAIPFRGGQTTWLTGDGLHLRSQYHGLIAAAIARQSQAALADQVPVVPR
jgi:lysophospholipase L1-like esterase